MATTISPTDPGYFADHDTEVLHKIVDEHLADSLTIALSHGVGHPMSTEHLALAAAAQVELSTREVSDAPQTGRSTT